MSNIKEYLTTNNDKEIDELCDLFAYIERSDDSTKEHVESSRFITGKKLSLAGTMLIACIMDVHTMDDSYIVNQNNHVDHHKYIESVEVPQLGYINEIYSHIFKIKTTKNELIKQIVSFESLKQNWDGYGALPLEVESAANALIFLNLLDEQTVQSVDCVFPNPHGTISIMWSNDSNERVSLEIGNNTYSYYVKYNNTNTPVFGSGKIINQKVANELIRKVKTL